MARLFNGTSDFLNATNFPSMDSGDWTIAAWVYALSAGGNSFGTVININDVTNATMQELRFNGASCQWRAQQGFSSTPAVASANSISNAVAPINKWQAVVATYRNSDKKCRIYIGTLTAAMTECNDYITQSFGSGTRSTGGINAWVGKNISDRVFDGRLAHVVVDKREWTLAEMEYFRFWAQPASIGTVQSWWPIYGSSSTVRDKSGRGVDLTLNGSTIIDGPPLYPPPHMGRRRRRIALR